MKIDKKNKLGILGTVGVPAKYGGFETLVHHLVLHLNQDFDITVYNSKPAYEKEERVEEWEGAKIVYIPLKANGYQSIFYDLFSMLHAIRRSDFLLLLGVSAGLFFPFFKLFSKKRIIVNIDGLEWRRPKWNWFAKTYLLLSEYIACRFADEIITDNRILQEYVKIRYNRKSTLIEYGADHTQSQTIQVEDEIKYPFIRNKYAFKVARIEPENNVHIVLEAFAKRRDINLVLVGNWDASTYGKKLRSTYNHYKNIFLLDPIYETKNLDVLRSNAYVYIHGHSAGGTNPSLVEAMYLKIPVISYDVIFNRVTTNNQAIYFSDLDELLCILKDIEKYPLYTIAENLKFIADKQYNWKNIAHRYAITIHKNFVTPINLHDFVPLESKKQVQSEAVHQINNL
jgi:glycosyltransferase involved in cell wall biosynthesis